MYIKSLRCILKPFQLPFLLVVLAYFCAKQILANSLLIIFIFIAILLAVIYKQKPYFANALLIIFGISIFDAIPLSEIPHIAMPVVGNQIDSQLLLVLIFIMFLNFLFGRSESIRSSISYPIIALILLTCGQVIRSFLEGNDPHFIMDRAKDILYYLSFFLILSSFRKKNDLISFLKLFIPIAVISAGVTYLQILTGVELASKIQYLEEYNIYQPVPLSLYVMTSVFLTVFSIVLREKVKPKYFNGYIIIILWIGGAITLTLLRSIWISTLLCASVMFILNSSRLNRTITILGLICISSLSGFYLFNIVNKTDLWSIFSDRISITYYDVREMGGTLGYRRGSVMLRWNYMIDNNPLFGQGFKGTMYDREFKQAHLNDPAIVEGDNMIAFLAARYGLAGFFVMGWLLYAVFCKAIRLLKILSNSWRKSVVWGILMFNIQMIVISFFSSVYVQVWSIIILAPSWAIMELIDRFYIGKENDVLVAKEKDDYK